METSKSLIFITIHSWIFIYVHIYRSVLIIYFAETVTGMMNQKDFKSFSLYQQPLLKTEITYEQKKIAEKPIEPVQVESYEVIQADEDSRSNLFLDE